MNERRHITVEGIVQGVGFRPFVYGLAMKNGLAGFVFNDTAGVTIELEGEPLALENFLTHLREQPPPLARMSIINASAGCNIRMAAARASRCSIGRMKKARSNTPM